MGPVRTFSLSVLGNSPNPLFSSFYPLIRNTALSMHFKISMSGVVSVHPSVAFFSFDQAIKMDDGRVRLGKTSSAKFVCRVDVWKKRLT